MSADVPVAATDVATAATPATPTTLRAYARHRAVNPSQVSRAVRSGRLSNSVTWTNRRPWINDVALADREWAAATDLTKAPASVLDRDRNQGADDGSGHVSDYVAREKFWRSKNAQLEYERKTGMLINAQSVEELWADKVTLCRTQLLALPRKLKALIPDLTLHQVNIIDQQVREALQVLASGESSR